MLVPGGHNDYETHRSDAAGRDVSRLQSIRW